jgi:Zn-dependent M28 family amino/carboxypeptidase
MSLSSSLERIVNVLARDIGPRSWKQRDRLERTAEFIAGEFRAAGYQPGDQVFSFRANSYRNVIAELPGIDPSAETLVIGAHYDTVETTPGADDNASGVACLLELARSCAGSRFPGAVRFVAFVLEEPPAYRTEGMGSYHYAESLKEAGVPIGGMICLEMVGYYSDRPGSQSYPLPFFRMKYPSTGNYISFVGNMRSREFTRRMAGAFRRGTDLPVVTLNAPAVVVGIDFSDHWSFNKFGYPALMITDTAFYRNPHYHAPSDRPETLDYVRMAKVVEGLAAAVETWGTSGHRGT